MKKFILFTVLIISCDNNAARFAKLIDKDAKCTPMVTSAGCGASRDHYDTAVCTYSNAIWNCIIDNDGRDAPNCTKIKDIPVEKP